VTPVSAQGSLCRVTGVRFALRYMATGLIIIAVIAAVGGEKALR